MTRLSIVIPAYNEADRIGPTLDAAATWLASRAGESEIIVVDDGSTDATAERVAARVPALGVALRLLGEPHRGKGGAVRAGMLAARGSLRFLADADLAMEFREVDRFLAAAAEGYDIVIGSRQAAGARRLDEPVFRHWLGRGFHRLVRLLAVRGIEDTQCGYKLFRAEAAERIFSLLTVEGFAFDVEALLIAQRLGLRIRELPITWISRPVSKVRPLRDALRMFLEVVRIRVRLLRGRYRQ